MIDVVRRAPRALGGGIGALGMLLGAVSLAYPFGRDQGLYHYVAREWLYRGALPYRDVFDQKTPGIYMLHAALIAVFGPSMWPIRLVEWLAMVPLGAALASLATPRGKKTPLWLVGAGVFAANVCYFGFFNFWETAQCEVWCVLFVVLAAWAATRWKARRPLTSFVAGLACAASLLMKPPSGAMVLVVFALVALGAWRDRALVRGVAAFGAGVALPLVATVAFLWPALADVKEVLFDVNAYYIRHDSSADGAVEILGRLRQRHHYHDPLASALLVVLGCVFVRGGGRRRRYALPIALLVAGTVGIVAQMKFYGYHYVLLVAGYALTIVMLAYDAASYAQRRGALALTGAVALTFVLSTPSSDAWAEQALNVGAFVVGARDREAFTDHFRLPGMIFYYHDSEKVGMWLREHTAPEDRVLVRGFEPQIYVVANREYGGRFFWDDFLVNPRRAYKRDEWLQRDRDDIARVQPKWVVAFEPRPDMPGWPEPASIERAEYFERLGYQRVKGLYGFVIMKRAGT